MAPNNFVGGAANPSRPTHGRKAPFSSLQNMPHIPQLIGCVYQKGKCICVFILKKEGATIPAACSAPSTTAAIACRHTVDRVACCVLPGLIRNQKDTPPRSGTNTPQPMNNNLPQIRGNPSPHFFGGGGLSPICCPGGMSCFWEGSLSPLGGGGCPSLCGGGYCP